MAIYLGASSIDTIKKGIDQVEKLYLGSNLLWENVTLVTGSVFLAGNYWETSGFVPSRSVSVYPPNTPPIKKLYAIAEVQNHVGGENATVRVRLQGRIGSTWYDLATSAYTGTTTQNGVATKSITYTFPNDHVTDGYDGFRAYSEGNSFRRGAQIYRTEWYE